MAKFGYVRKQEMDPRPGKTYHTDYYKQSASERARTLKHIESTIERVGEKARAEGTLDALTIPMKDFQRRETKGAYSIYDIMNDLHQQMKDGKDIPSGMLGRWNKLFDGSGREIEMVLESELPPPNNFGDLLG